MFVLNKCCFCIELRTGCFIIAYIQLLIEILTFALALNGIVDSTSMLQSRLKTIREMSYLMLSFSLTLLAFVALIFLFTILLIVGLHKRSVCHVLAYLICASIHLIVFTTIAFTSFPMMKNLQQDIAYKISSLILHAYFIFVIRSYWKAMGLKNRAIYTA